jgi:pseudaminic acid synthase
MKCIRIGEKEIGENSPCFIIAELSANHGSDIEIAKETIRAAKRAGADAIKLQTFTPDTITLKCDSKDFLIDHGTLWDGRYLHDLYSETALPWEWHQILFDTAREEGIICFSSPFDFTAVDFLESLNTPAYKIASPEIVDIPLIEYVASKGKPVILSTGIATLEDIELALNAVRRLGNNNIVLLKCTTSYPAPIEDANMAMIPEFKNRFDVISGLSDHTIGNIVPIVATCFGAKIIEKHFILDRAIGGADASFSLDEKEFTEMVMSVRQAESAIGIVDYSMSNNQIKARDFGKSIYAVQDIEPGELISKENVKIIRPGFGLHPKYFKDILGKKSVKKIKKGERFELTMVE